MAPLEHRAMLGHQRERPLLRMKLGAFVYPDLRPVGGPAESREAGHVDAEVHCIIAPMAGGDHASVEVEDAPQLQPVESGQRAPVPGARERRDDAQALFALGAGARLVLSTAISI